jgi:hypothetical protein
MSAIAYGRTSSGLWGDPGVGADDDPGAAPDHGPHQGAGHLHEGRDDRRQGIPATVRGMQVETNVPLAARSAMNLRVGSRAVRGEKRRVLHSVESSFAGSDDAVAPVGVCCDRQPVQVRLARSRAEFAHAELAGGKGFEGRPAGHVAAGGADRRFTAHRL